MYYECKKLGHIKYDCPFLKKRWKMKKKKNKKGKAMKATENDSDSSIFNNKESKVRKLSTYV